MLRTPPKHCRNCGTAVDMRLPDDGDTKIRAVCPTCHTVHYENPLNVVGTVPVWGEAGEYVLLCKRNIEPRWGKWTLGDIFTLMNVARVGQVHIYYRARLLSDRFDPGHETIEARLFTEDQIPWDEIAFRTVKETLEHYFADRRQGRFGFHAFDIA
jgi:hypothetical protein